MRFLTRKILLALPALAAAATLKDICTSSYIASKLPANNFLDGDTPTGINFEIASISAIAVYNGSLPTSGPGADASAAGMTFDYCNVTVAYSHAGLANDRVQVMYGMPAPASFKNRWLSTGGGGLAINSGSSGLTAGQVYGAASGLTDGGFGSFKTQFNAVFLLANGTVNYAALKMFGYQAIHEMTLIGQQLTKGVYGLDVKQKLYSYYSGCSEGGREGWSQVQRFGDQFDGVAIGAPAFRYGFQQANHLYANTVQKTMEYYPPPCELAKIVTETIAACDPLDGKTDGVVSRSDLCKLKFNLDTIIGKPYSCAAAAAGAGKMPKKNKRQLMKKNKRQMMGGGGTPAQKGNITAQGVAVAKKMLDGLKDSDGKQAYFYYQIASSYGDAATKFDATTGKWGLSVNSMGSEWITRFLQLKDSSTLLSADELSYDQLKEWMIYGWQTYEDVLQTTWPDLTPFQRAGGKVLHYHGEADSSIPAASSVRFHDSVRTVMYPNMTYDAGSTALNEWYKLFIVPGAEHCGANSLQPNGPFPTAPLTTVIDWVEKGAAPTTLNGTVTQGTNKGQTQQICGWPLRPLWTNGTMDCVYDQKSIDAWTYDLNAIKLPVY